MTAAYALFRRSRSHQDLSIEEQRQAVRAWAADHDYRIVREFSDDASGLDTARRREFLALLELCADPKRREADVVLCYDVSRFSRLDPDEAAYHEHSLRRAGVQILYTHEPGANDSGMGGHVVKSVKRVLAHEYSQKLSQVTTRGLRAHAALGHWTGGRPPYGYARAVKKPDGAVERVPDGRWKARGETVVLVEDPATAPVVREIYDLYARHALGLAAIADRLNRRGVPPPASLRRCQPAIWTKSTLWSILRNPAYAGTLTYAKFRYKTVGRREGRSRRPAAEWIVVEGAFPVLVSTDLWRAAQARHGTRRFGVGRPFHRPYLLSGLIVCGACGRRWQAKRRPWDGGTAYVCGGYVMAGPSVCDRLHVPVDYLDQAVLDGVQKRLLRVLDPRALRERLTARLRAAPTDTDTLAAMEGRLAEVRRKIPRLVEALAAGPEDLRSVRGALVELEREQDRLEAAIAGARRAAAAASDDATFERTVGTLLETLHDFRQVLDTGEPEERKEVVRCFVEGIRIEKPTRRAIVRWYRLPPVKFESPWGHHQLSRRVSHLRCFRTAIVLKPRFSSRFLLSAEIPSVSSWLRESARKRD